MHLTLHKVPYLTSESTLRKATAPRAILQVRYHYDYVVLCAFSHCDHVSGCLVHALQACSYIVVGIHFTGIEALGVFAEDE